MIERAGPLGEIALVCAHTGRVILKTTNRVAHEGSRTFARLGAEVTTGTFLNAGQWDIRMAVSNSPNVAAAAINNQDAGGDGGFVATDPFVAGSLAAMDATYPKVNDDDPNNPFSDLANKLTARVTYLSGSGDFSGETAQGIVLVSANWTIGSYTASSKILAAGRFLTGSQSITWPSADVKVFYTLSIQSP